jgi:tetratricopeptide (TPR) repeat protein
VVILAVVVAGWRLRRSRPVVALAIAGYAILFATTSNFVITIGTIMAERLVYMPSILFCALVGIGAWELASVVGRRTIAIALTVVACVLIGLTFARNRTWSDNLTFSREQVRTAPESAKAHVNLASALGNIGDDRGAASEYERALEILPTYPKIHYQLGNARHRLNADPETVVDAYRHAIEDDPADVDARANLAWTLIDLGRLDAARASVNELRALAPNHELLPKLSKRLAQKQKRENPPLR